MDSRVFHDEPFLSLRTSAHDCAALRLPIECEGFQRVVWIYARDHEELRCEVRPTESGFLLAVSCPGSPEQLEQFKTAGGVIAHHNAIERRLQKEGWQLTDFYPAHTNRDSKR